MPDAVTTPLRTRVVRRNRPVEPKPVERGGDRTGLPLAVVVVAIVAGLALRLYVLRSPLGGMDSDEAVSALISRELLHGHVYAFLPNLAHGGTLLAWPRAALLCLIGPDRIFTKSLETVVFAGACVVTWRIGRRLFDERTGRLAGLLLWVYPPAAVWESTKVMLYYTPAMVVSALAVLLCVRLAQDDAGTRTARDVAWLGFVVGLGVWIHPMVFYAAAPAVVWLVVRRPRLLADAWRAVPPALVGAAPWIAYNLRHGFPSLKQPVGAAPSTYSDRLSGFFDSLLPRALGLHNFYLGDWFLAPLSVALYAAVVVAVLVAYRRWHGDRTILLAIAMTYGFLFAIPKNSVFNLEPRYGMPLLPAIALGAAYTVSLVPWRRVAGPAALALAALVSAVSLHRVVVLTDSPTPNVVLRPAPTGEVWAYLDARGIDRVYADYWTAYRLVWEDRRPLVVLPARGDYFRLTPKSDGAGASVAVFEKTSDGAARWQALVAKLGLTSEVDDIGAYVAVRTSAPVPVASMLGVLDAPPPK